MQRNVPVGAKCYPLRSKPFTRSVRVVIIIIFQSAVTSPLDRLTLIPSLLFQADGGAYSASVNAATLALIDAGIPMKAYLCSCTASIAWKDGKPEPLVDVSHVEESAGGSVLTVSSLPSISKWSSVLKHLIQLNFIDRYFSKPFYAVLYCF